MAKTVAQLAKQVMLFLRRIDAQEEVAAEDFGMINDAYSSKFEELSFREIAYWDIDQIDDKAFLPMARILAEECAPTFGAPVPMEFAENGSPVSMGTKGLLDLRRITARAKSGLPTMAEFY